MFRESRECPARPCSIGGSEHSLFRRHRGASCTGRGGGVSVPNTEKVTYTPTPEAPIRRVAPIRASSSGCGRTIGRLTMAARILPGRRAPITANCDDERARLSLGRKPHKYAGEPRACEPGVEWAERQDPKAAVAYRGTAGGRAAPRRPGGEHAPPPVTTPCSTRGCTPHIQRRGVGSVFTQKSPHRSPLTTPN